MNGRIKFSQICLYLASIVIIGRLFYWQIIQGPRLAALAQDQRTVVETLDASRGSIKTSDGFILTANQDQYLLYAYLPQLTQPTETIAHQLAPLVLSPPKDATEAAIPQEQRIIAAEADLRQKLNLPDKKWVPLVRGLERSVKEAVEQLNIVGLGFDRYQRRYYPEASMSAHLLGFVGQDDAGNRKGYFGLEGYYDLELEGKHGKVIQEKDPMGKPILIGFFDQWRSRQGRNLQLHLDRSLQHLAETHLLDGLEKYGAISGEIIIMEPFSGAILASASFPNYDPSDLGAYDVSTYKNPVIANTYEPGSTFKVLVMAAGIDAGVINPQTVCDSTCDAAVPIGKYRIRTWNETYTPGQTMSDVLANSDNTGMVFVSRQLGQKRFVEYLEKFGLGSLTEIDLQEEATTKLKDRWSEIDVATASFGQGIAVTGIQMVQAISAIANGGTLMKPHVVAQVEDEKRILEVEPEPIRQVVSPATAKQVTDMMVYATQKGEAKWAVLKDYEVAGKTGTAQIPIDGHYDQEKTIASFVGFAPAYDPKFVMLVKLREPSTSPWAAETAAPLWYGLAKDILLYYKVAPTL